MTAMVTLRPAGPPSSLHRTLVAILVLACAWLVPAPAGVAAATTTYYVDGKTGSDSNSGASSSSAFKTIARAASALPRGNASGYKVIVKGYTDYAYRERAIPSTWDRYGSSGRAVVFQAAGYVAGSSKYVKPIVSGADRVSSTKWTSSGTTGVWKTPWPTKPFGYGTYSGDLRTALFQDTTTWLWEQSSMSALAGRAKKGTGGYLWSGGYLYATAVGSPSSSAIAPANHAIDVIMRHTFYFEGHYGVKYVEVRGFEVRHSANGIAFAQGVDYGVAADDKVVGNLPMGIGVSGRRSGSTLDPAIGAAIVRNTGSRNTLQAVKLDMGSQKATVCDNRFAADGLQGIKVQGPRDGNASDLKTTGVLICRNELLDHDYNPSGSAYNNANGLAITNGAQNVTVEDNRLHGNDVGIHISQETSGRAKMDGIVLRRNHAYDNRRFGIFFYDGANGTSAAAGSMRSEFDLVWNNGIGVQVGRGSTHKTLVHLTAFDNLGDGVRIGEGSSYAAAAATISDSLLTNNAWWGLNAVSGSSGVIKYTGVSGNGSGSVKGTLTKTAVNYQAPGYKSTSTSSADYLRISSSSYQYTAGSAGGPVGAKY